MNRRSFLTNIAVAAAAFTILPSASTYQRNWVKTRPNGLWVINPEWVNAEYEVAFVALESGLKITHPVPHHYKAFEKFIPKIMTRSTDVERMIVGLPPRFKTPNPNTLVPMYIKQT